MRRTVSLLWLGTLCACAGGARASRVPVAPPAAPARVPATPAPRPVAGVPAAEGMVNVPSLLGLDFEIAAARARAVGLELMALRVPGLPVDVVIEQNPAAGRAVPAGAPMRVGIGAGPATASTPPVPPAPPVEVATDAGLPPALPPELPPSVLPELPPSALPEGPAAPPAVEASTEPLPVPSVLDRTEPVARRILTDAGFRVRIEATESGVKGRVMDQLPSPGDRVPRGSEILLKVPGFVATADAPLGSPDAAPADAVPASPPVATAPPDPVAPPPPAPPPVVEVAEAPAVPQVPALPPVVVAPPSPEVTPDAPAGMAPESPLPEPPLPEPVAPTVGPTVDEAPVPIFAGPKSVAGSTPPIPPAVPETPAAPAPPAAPPSPVPDVPAGESVAPPVFAPPALPPVEIPLPATPPDAPAAPDAPVPADAVPVPVPPSDAVPVPVPPSDAVPAPVPPSDAVPIPPSDAVPVLPPAPPTSTATTEPAGQPAGPSVPGLEIPKPKSPPNESQIPIAPSVSVDLSWEPVPDATGYLIELEELVDGAWTPLQRRIVKAPKALAQIEPSNPRSADVRWRVRSVVGRRGGRPAAWVVFHLR